ncbi:MAG: TIGR04255 family protein [Candidatus Marinimicrobia bacterium]|nr:TIGR04255 family protein [Candidatus Neomarinimicrobiota bacterium]
MTHPLESTFSSGALPSYKNPPVNEVICGMQFHAPSNLRIPHIGLLWDKFRADYPIIQHAAPVASAKGEILIDKTIGMPLPRVWFINKMDDQLVQFQMDRFYFNWRRRKSDYPRYNHVIKNFESVLNTIVKFFGEFEFGEFKPIEYELTYINHIPKGQGWNMIDDLPRIFPDFVWKQTKERFLPYPEKVAWQSEFPLPEQTGHLIVTLKQAIRTEDKVPLLVLELKTRGISESTSTGAILKWFDLAHEWIVQSFTDLTTPEIQKVWEREENA